MMMTGDVVQTGHNVNRRGESGKQFDRRALHSSRKLFVVDDPFHGYDFLPSVALAGGAGYVTAGE
jgi:hypothetical protein